MTPPDCTGVITFNYPEWIVQYPEFANVSQPVAQSYFNRATLVVDNTPQSPIQDLFQRTILLNLATCHIAQLSGALSGDGKTPPPGRISSATQGSVSVSLEFPSKGGAMAAWWNQTSYGAEFYASTLQYRTAVYYPPPQQVPTIPFFGRYGAGVIRRR